MGLTPPSKRETLLVCLLLLGLYLIFVPETRHLDQNFVTVPVPVPLPQRRPQIPLVEEEGYDTRLTWGAAKVPQTKIIAHVPG
jgi:hypothetical protein